ncbi:Gfo/Idh/MocA family protein [Amaricoccus tamworthensis]|uniref:Gfo/Idh/MocA family protein n=1 Tax=Amaricoccus tamworthensis TaxID=57002 RepID=UPI003C7A5A2E
MRSIGIGIIGCGNISDAYLKAAPDFKMLRLLAVADINTAAAEAKSQAYGVPAKSVEALLNDPEIGIVLNLTTPQYHVEVGLAAIAHGKHVYSEKPLAVTFAEGQKLVAAARDAGLRVGCAPDTFLGGAHQTARRLIDAGAIGRPVAASAFMQVPGHELWHPNPDFYYQAGGGPMLDMGPYYLTCLINMLGPVTSVSGMAATSHPERTIASGPRAGETVAVEVPTHISGLLTFASGASVTITTSFEVWKHGHNPIEVYGSTGSMIVADPNRFDGDTQVADGKDDWQVAEMHHHYGDGNYRIIGLADMAAAILDDRPHRADDSLSLHVLEVMEGILASAERGERLTMTTTCERPAPLDPARPFGEF